jgi:hypothetical protein
MFEFRRKFKFSVCSCHPETIEIDVILLRVLRTARDLYGVMIVMRPTTITIERPASEWILITGCNCACCIVRSSLEYNSNYYKLKVLYPPFK